MGMELYLLRHAIAKPRSSRYEDDSKRPLTKEGRQKMAKNAEGMKNLGIAFNAVISSPYVRARETAEIAVEVLKIKKPIQFCPNLVPDVPFDLLVDELKTKFSKAGQVILVGHEPHMSHFISFLLTSGQQISIDLKKGGLCCLTLPKITGPGGATLNWLLTPSQLQLMAR